MEKTRKTTLYEVNTDDNVNLEKFEETKATKDRDKATEEKENRQTLSTFIYRRIYSAAK